VSDEDPLQPDVEWLQRMADLEDKHGGFPGFSGRLPPICPVCGVTTRDLVAHAAGLDDAAHVIYSVLES